MAELRPDRLIALREQKGISQSELARRSGVGQSTIVRLEAGGTRNPKGAHEIADVLDTSADYLMGKTDDPCGKKLSDKRLRYSNATPTGNPDVVEMNQIDLRYGLGANYIDGHITAEKRSFSRAWLRHLTDAAPDQLFWATGDGDSMEPTIRSGEVILIDRTQISARMGDGIWAIAWGDIAMIKRLRPLPDGNIEIHSDNKHVRPATASDGEVHVIGRVIAVMRKL